MNELVGGNVKQRFIAQQQVEHDPGGSRTEDDRTEHRSVQVAHDLLEGEKDGRNGCIEGGRQSRRSANRHQSSYPSGAEPQPASEHRRDSGADLNGRPFAAQCDAGGQREGREAKLADDGAQADVSIAEEQGCLGLRDAAAAGIWKIAGQQDARGQCADHRQNETPPGRTSRRIHACAKVLGHVYEGDHHQADDGADDQRQQQEDLIFVIFVAASWWCAHIPLDLLLSGYWDLGRQSGGAGRRRWTSPQGTTGKNCFRSEESARRARRESFGLSAGRLDP